jgi:hypothetical protein
VWIGAGEVRKLAFILAVGVAAALSACGAQLTGFTDSVNSTIQASDSKDLGATTARIPVSFIRQGMVNPTTGHVDWSSDPGKEVIAEYNNAVGESMQPFFIFISAPNAWHGPGYLDKGASFAGCSASPDDAPKDVSSSPPMAELDRWAVAVKDVVQGPPGNSFPDLYGVEVWNEPNLQTFWGGTTPQPSVYVQLLEATYDAVNSVRPALRVASGGLAPGYACGFYPITSGPDDAVCNPPPGFTSCPGYLHRMNVNGAVAVSDAIAYHPYPEKENLSGAYPSRTHTPREIADRIENQTYDAASERCLYESSCDGVAEPQIWVTETGVPVCNGDYNSDWYSISPRCAPPDKQCRVIMNLLADDQPYDVATWFTLRDQTRWNVQPDGWGHAAGIEYVDSAGTVHDREAASALRQVAGGTTPSTTLCD